MVLIDEDREEIQVTSEPDLDNLDIAREYSFTELAQCPFRFRMSKALKIRLFICT